MMLSAEFRKLRTVRTVWVVLALAQVVIVAGVSGLMLNRADATSLAEQRGAVAHVGLVSLFVCWRLLPKVTNPEGGKNIDYVGAALFAAAIGPILIGLSWMRRAAH